MRSRRKLWSALGICSFIAGLVLGVSPQTSEPIAAPVIQPVVVPKPPIVAVSAGHRKQEACLVEAIWHEARGEPVEGMRAVATVIINRAEKQKKDFCKVVRAPKQFSYVSQKRVLEPIVMPSEARVYKTVTRIAKDVMSKRFKRNLPSSVLWYTEVSVSNQWTKKLKAYTVIGRHKFYAA